MKSWYSVPIKSRFSTPWQMRLSCLWSVMGLSQDRITFSRLASRRCVVTVQKHSVFLTTHEMVSIVWVCELFLLAAWPLIYTFRYTFTTWPDPGVTLAVHFSRLRRQQIGFLVSFTYFCRISFVSVFLSHLRLLHCLDFGFRFGSWTRDLTP